jgi:uncharacterized damage-inducible protein DinB
MSSDVLKAQLHDRFAREHATTMRVIRAFPEPQWAFRPHERSPSAFDLLATMVRELAGVEAVLNRTWTMPPTFPDGPTTWSDGVTMLDDAGARVIDGLARSPDGRLTESVVFFTGPGTAGPMPVHDLLWFWLLDTIHHRGQLSVYVRLAGGRVPAIYGPSADEPWS